MGIGHRLQNLRACHAPVETVVSNDGIGQRFDHRQRQMRGKCRGRPCKLTVSLIHWMFTKKAKSSRSTVGTNTLRSRYLLPRSHEVSGANRQAWQAAPCKRDAFGQRAMLCTERVAGT